MDTFPDLGSLDDQELKDLIQQLTEEEIEVSYRRRILHGKIDILRAELVNRLRKKHEGGEAVISGADVERLTDILAGARPGGSGRLTVRRGEGGEWPSTAPSAASSTPRAPTTARSAARFLGARRGGRRARRRRPTAIGETGELEPGRDRGGRRRRGPALVIRAGGGRVGRELPAGRRAHDHRPAPGLPTCSSTTSPSRATTR